MTFTYLRGHFFLFGITPGYHMSMHAKKCVPRLFRLAVIEKYHVCDGHTNRMKDRHTDGKQTQAFVLVNHHRYDPYQLFDP